MDGQLISKEKDRNQVAATVYQYALDYILDQVNERRSDRVIELAFYHEALQNEKLQLLVLNYWQNYLAWLSTMHRAIGSPYPEDDAQITLSLFLRLENEAIMADSTANQMARIKSTLKRHIGLCCGVDLGSL